MTRLAEMGHVLVKDIREARRLLLLYVAIVAVATAHAAGLGVFARESFGPAMLFVVLVGALIVASAVQADSPTRSDAFWATHPFRRSSMLGAKVMFALLLVASATIGQAIGVYSYDLRGVALGWLVLGSGLIFGGVLLAVMLLASITRDLRSLVLAAIAIPLVVIVTMVVVGRDTPVNQEARAPLQVLGAAAATSLVVWLYLTRDGRRRTRLAACAVVALTFLATCSNPSTLSIPGREATVATAPPITMTLEPPDPRARLAPGQLQLNLRVTEPEEGIRARLELNGADIRLRDGSTLRAPIQNSEFDLGAPWSSRLAVPRMPGIRWLGEVRHHNLPIAVMPRLTPAQRRAVAAGVASVAIDGRVHLWESRAAETMPLVVGSALTTVGGRARIVDWRPEDDTSMVVIDATSIDAGRSSASRPTSMLDEMWGFVLVNESRREAVPLQRMRSSGSLDGLVLPGVPLRSERAHHGLRVGQSSDTWIPDAAWLRDARLQLVTSNFRGSYPLKLELKYPPASAGSSRSAQ